MCSSRAARVPMCASGVLSIFIMHVFESCWLRLYIHFVSMYCVYLCCKHNQHSRVIRTHTQRPAHLHLYNNEYILPYLHSTLLVKYPMQDVCVPVFVLTTELKWTKCEKKKKKQRKTTTHIRSIKIRQHQNSNCVFHSMFRFNWKTSKYQLKETKSLKEN